MYDIKEYILASIKDDLDNIEDALWRNLTPHFALVEEIAKHILFSGGKRFRPLLMVLSARICGYKGNHDTTIASVFEYLHAATLLHDDLVDGASKRRGKRAAYLIWGNSAAVLVGDFLLARSLSIATKTNKPEVIKVIAEITENMSQGEVFQLMKKGDLGLSENEYMDIITRKTAFLFQGACHVGALIADSTDVFETAMSEYGLNLGMAFQITDDLLDYTSHAEVLGKKAGSDLREGKLTLPVIYALKKADSDDRTVMENILENKEFTDTEFRVFVQLIKKHEGILYAFKMAEDYIAKAKKALGVFSSSKTKKLLESITDYAITRQS